MGIVRPGKGVGFTGSSSSRLDASGKKKWIWFAAPWLLLGAMILLVFQQSARLHSSTSSSSSMPIIGSKAQAKPSSSSSSSSRIFFVAAVIFNRVFKEDLFNITDYECKQWIEYMLNAGVDHIYWYDTAHSDSESQQQHLKRYVSSGALTYHRFYHLFPVVEGSDFHYEQDNSYRHFVTNYNASVNWVVEMDVDEYPFSPSDTSRGFLSRYVTRLEPSVSQVLLQCMMFAGNPIGEGWIIERYQRRKAQSEGMAPGFHSRQKPIFQPRFCEGVSSFDPHSFKMRRGDTVVAHAEEMRMNHYWGPRITDFGPDTPEVLKVLVQDSSIQPIASELRKRIQLL